MPWQPRVLFQPSVCHVENGPPDATLLPLSFLHPTCIKEVGRVPSPCRPPTAHRLSVRHTGIPTQKPGFGAGAAQASWGALRRLTSPPSQVPAAPGEGPRGRSTEWKEKRPDVPLRTDSCGPWLGWLVRTWKERDWKIGDEEIWGKRYVAWPF